jgi:hypothetical protein
VESEDRQLVNDQWVGPRKQMFGFLHCLISWLGRETGYGPADLSVGVLWIVSGAPFLGSSDSVQHCR